MTDEVRVIPEDAIEVLDPDTVYTGGLGLPVVTHAHPFSSSIQLQFATAGQSIESVVADAALPAEYREFLRVYIADVEILPAEWATTYVTEGQTIYIRVVPGKDGKDIFRAIAMIVITAVAYTYGGPIGASIAGKLGFAAGTLGANIITGLTIGAIATVGYLALNALIPPPGSQNNQQDSRFKLTGSNNQFAPYANIPRVFGKRRVYPLLAARPYSEIQGDDEYLRMALVVGWGPLEITQIKIGETPITAFDDVQYEVREGWTTDQPLTLFSKTVTEDSFQIQLQPFGFVGNYYDDPYGYGGDDYYYDPTTGTYGPVTPTNTNDWAQRTTAINTVEFSVDIAFPQGLFRFDNKGKKQTATVVCEVQYRAVGSGTWLNAVWQNNADQGFGTPGQITVTASEASAVRRSGLVKPAAPGQFEVRIRRTTQNSGDKWVDLVWWTVLRSIKQDYPVLQSGVSLIALRIKASNQLNGVPQTINCVAESYLPVYNGTSWNFTKTSNPAWAFADILRRRGTETFIPDNRIDLPAIQAWATACDATAPNASEPRWTFNAVIEGGSAFDALRQIASNARANYTLTDAKHSVVRDIQQTVPVQHITPRNSFGYSGSKVFVEYPHALRVTFFNKDLGWQQDERIVYDDGYNAGNATKFEVLDLQGCTSATQAFREARYYMAVARLRPEEHTVQMDIEGLRCTVGDLVLFQHDAVAIGVMASRVRSVTVNGSSQVTTVTLDDDVYFETGNSYVVRARKSLGTSVVVSVNNPGTGYATTLTLTTPTPIANAPAVGDLVMFGIASAEVAPMIIKKIEPSEDFVVTVTMVDAQNGVYTADTGTIPAFNSYLTLPSLPTGGSLPAVYISTVRSDDGVIVINNDGSITYRIFVQLQQPAGSTERVDYFEIQWREQGAPAWQVERVERAQPFAYLGPVVVGRQYDLRSRGMSDAGVATDWSTYITHTVVGKNIPPGVPTGVTATAISGGIRLAWTNPEDDDLWQIEVYENTTNNSATATVVAQVTADTYDRLGLSASNGVRYYFLKAVDTNGNKSPFTTVVSATANNKALVLSLTNDSVSLPASSAGVVTSFADAVGRVFVYDGDQDVTASATLSRTEVNCTGTVNTATNTPVSGQPKGYYQVTAMSANTATLTLTAVYNGQTVQRNFSLSKALAGAAGAGSNAALVYAYQRATSAPFLPNADATFTFATAALTGLTNGWTATIPAGTNPIWVTTATASGTGATDTILPSDWAAAVVLAQNGSNGTNGINAATVYLFQRTTTGTAPALPNAQVTYTFATGVASNLSNSWTQTMPTTGGAFRWMTLATALGTGATDTIETTEWQAAALLAQDGTSGSSAIAVNLSKPSVAVFAYANGDVPSFADAAGLVTVFEGATNVTNSATFSASATGCTGTVNTAVNTPVSGQPRGYYRVTAMSADSASLTITTTYNSVSYVRTFALSKVRTGFEIVAALPSTNLFEGRIVYLTTDDKLYRYNGTAWVREVAAADITGTITGAQIADAALTTAKFASSIEPVTLVTSVPTTKSTSSVFNTTDGFLYRWNGTAYVKSVPSADISGTITGTQIANDAITTPKIAAGAVTATQIAANTITAAQIAADTITSGQIAAGAITASEIAAGAVTASRIAVIDLTNVFPDPDIQEPTLWTVAGDITASSSAGTGAGFKSRGAITFTKGALTGYAFAAPPRRFQVDPSRQYRCEFQHEAGVAGTSNFWLRIQWLDGSGNAVNGGAAEGQGYTTIANISNLTATGITNYATLVTPPTAARQGELRFYVERGASTRTFRLGGHVGRVAANGELIVDGSIIANKIASNAVTADKILAGSVTAAKISVTSLSSLTADVGTLTAGVIRNAGDSFRVDVSNGRTITNVGGYMKVTGAPFGSSSQFIEWYGPYQANLANCTETAAVYYLKTNGAAYFGGSLLSGVLKNSTQATNLTNANEAILGPFSSNGGIITITPSFSFQSQNIFPATTQGLSDYNAKSKFNPTFVMALDRSLAGGSYSNVATYNVTGSWGGEPPTPGDSEGIYVQDAGFSSTFTDNVQTTQSRTYKLRFTTWNQNANVFQNTLGLVSTE